MSDSITESNLALWARADQYHNAFLLKPDAVLDAVQKNTREKGIDYEIAVSPALGKFLNLLLRSISAKRVLELLMYMWVLTDTRSYGWRALPEDGEVVALELEALHAQAIEENFKTAGLSSKMKVIVGPAHAYMRAMRPEPSFDLVFIDADKPNNTNYFIEAKRLLRAGGVIVRVWISILTSWTTWAARGVADPANTNASVEGVRGLLRYIKDDDEVEATTIHTVGEKGFDGFLYAVKK
ncbi:O-methyltransferase [Mycena epipterygia]|nr:O-methyltransferase [Mycena epipterygia]